MHVLRTRIDEADFEIAETLISAALVGIDSPTSTLENLKQRLQRDDDGMRALCALQMLDSAQKSSKAVGLSSDEQLLFVLIKTRKVFCQPRVPNPHKTMFLLLTGRSSNWWEKNHMNTLARISGQHTM